MKNLGIVIIVLGILMTIFTGFNIISKKKVVDLGAIEIDKTERTPIYWSPVTGLVIIAVGGVILLTGRKKLN